MDFLRWMIIGFSIASTWMFVTTLLRRWAGMLPADRAVSVGFASLLVSVGYAAGEALHQDLPFGFRVALTFASLAGLCVALAFQMWSHVGPQRRH